MFNDAQVESEIKALIDDFVKAYPKDDIDRYLSFWDRSPDLLVFGTGEKWLGWEDYKSAPALDRQQYDKIEMTYDWLKVNSQGSTAWLATEVTLKITIGNELITLPARGTMVLVKTDERWLIIQAHISSPSMGDST